MTPEQITEPTCNSDDRDGRCNADDGEPCAKCQAAWAEDFRYWLDAWNRSTFIERYGREAYERQMREAGRAVKVSP